MRILLLGKNGQVGKALERLLLPLGAVVAMGREDLNVADSEKLRGALRMHKPDIVINATAYTDVDRAEVNKDLAWKVNAEAPGVMMEELNTWKGALVHFSTDYVFDGGQDYPYVEGDAPNPINEYGKSKLEGERLVKAGGDRYLILRTSWVYAMESRNFVSKVLEWASLKETLRIVDDQVGSPSWAEMLAEVTTRLLIKKDVIDFINENSGIYHCSGNGAVSRYDFAKKILSVISTQVPIRIREVVPAKSSEFPSLALRPGYSALGCSKFENMFGMNLPDWELSLLQALSAQRIRFN